MKAKKITFDEGVDLISEKIQKEMFNSIVSGFGVVGSRVWLNDKDQIEVKILSLDECLDLLEREKNGELISEEYSITKFEI